MALSVISELETEMSLCREGGREGGREEGGGGGWEGREGSRERGESK